MLFKIWMMAGQNRLNSLPELSATPENLCVVQSALQSICKAVWASIGKIYFPKLLRGSVVNPRPALPKSAYITFFIIPANLL